MADPSPRFTLYMSGTSYYAEKVIVTLFLKKEPFTKKFINTQKCQNYDPWFMRMNPAGKIPVLDDRGKIITESEAILDYLDAEITREPQLVPDPSTNLGQEVARLRKLLDGNLAVLSFGIAYNPDLAPAGRARMSRAEQDAVIDSKISQLEKMASENPDLSDAYLAKIPPLQNLRKDRRNPDVVKGVMNDFQTTLDEVEALIVKSEKDMPGETWLFGSCFTAADISLSVLLRRMSLLGLSSLYFTQSKRPALHGYWQRLQTDPAFLTLSDINIDFLYVVD